MRNNKWVSVALRTTATVGVAATMLTGTAVQAKSAPVVTITEMDYWTSPPTSVIVPQILNDFMKTHPNIKIVRDAVPFGALLPKADQEALTHALPNLLMLDNPQLQAFASTGALEPLKKFGSVPTNKYYKGSLSTVMYNNVLYGLPVGNNNLALFYNKKMFAAAHLAPPKTWAQLETDAKKLSHGNVYGLAFSAPNEEEATWQFEPFLWTNGGHLRQIDSPQALAALNFWVRLVKEGAVSKGVLNWTQSDVGNQFIAGHAAMMIMGPWEMSLLDQTKGLDYGTVPIPTPKAGMSAVDPLGGEVFTIPASSSAKEQAAWTFLNWMQSPHNLVQINKALGYIPAYIPAANQLLKISPNLRIFANNLKSGRARTQYLGAKYPQASEAVWTAIQAAIVGTMTPSAALKQAQSTINQLK